MADTVKRANLDGEIVDTFATEAELNGWRERQWEMFDRDDYRERKPVEHDPRQLPLSPPDES